MFKNQSLQGIKSVGSKVITFDKIDILLGETTILPWSFEKFTQIR